MSANYGFQDNVARALNITPAAADRLIAEGYGLAGGRIPFDWFAAELRRLAAQFAAADQPTDAEQQFILELARRADRRGIVNVARDDLARTLEWQPRDVGNSITWGQWRGSFRFRRTSEKGQPPTYRFRLRDWPTPTPGSTT